MKKGFSAEDAEDAPRAQGKNIARLRSAFTSQRPLRILRVLCAESSAWLQLRRFDEDDFGFFDADNLDAGLAADCRAVARVNARAVHFDCSGRWHQIGVADGIERKLQMLARLDGGAEHARLGTDRQCVVVIGKAARQRDETPGAFGLREWLRAPGWRSAGLAGLDPDLEQARRLVLEIVFGMANAGAGRHHLYIASARPPGVAHGILMRDRAVADIGDDLHVGVRMRRKAGFRRDLVVVPDAQRAPAHAPCVVIAGEREMVCRLQPAMVGGAQCPERSDFDHVGTPRNGGSESIWCAILRLKASVTARRTYAAPNGGGFRRRTPRPARSRDKG